MVRPESQDREDAPTGMPDGSPEAEPLGPPDERPEGEDQPPRGDEAMPGIPTEGEPPSDG